MAYPYGSSIDNQVQNLEQQLAFAKQRQVIEQQRQMQPQIQYNNIPMQQNSPQISIPVTAQPQSNVDWIVIKTFDEAKKIVLGGYNEKWFRVDGTMTVGMKFVENGFEQIEYYNLVETNPFIQEQVVEQPQVDLTSFVRIDDVNRALSDLTAEINNLKQKIAELENKETITQKTATNRKAVSDNVK